VRVRPVDGRDAGFTLLEVIIAASLLLVATIPMYRFFDSSVKQVTTVQGMIEEQAKARNAMSSLENDLRNSFTGSASLGRIESIGATAITFYTPDRLSPMRLRKVSYQLSSGTFRRWTLSSTNTVSGSTYVWSFPTTTAAQPYLPIVNGVTNTVVFEYRDKDNVVLNPAVTGNAAKVRTVKATLQVRDPKAKTTQNADTYEITVQLRGEG
jgi:prepilin-type N-terminal cleavage/methylation domain-containing protein